MFDVAASDAHDFPSTLVPAGTFGGRTNRRGHPLEATTNPARSIDLFGLGCLDATTEGALDLLLDGHARRTAVFINAHCVNVAANVPEYRSALDTADVALPDGSGIQIAAKMTGRRFRENLNGTDLFPPLCRAAAERGLSIFFLGSEPGVALAAAQKAEQIAPGLKVAGTLHGFFYPEAEDDVITYINRSGADIVLVAMGVPKQDVWIARNRERLNARLAVGVGAQFDFWSGRVSRAPKLLRRLGLEWAWRLAIEPRRMANRYLVGNITFLVRAARNAIAWHAKRWTMQGVTKRLFDIGVASAALAVLSPLLLLAAAAIRIESQGPVLFRQQRVGKDGKHFPLLKFRSMYRDAEARRAALLERSDRAGICFKSKSDPRITKVGRFIRRFSIDELPQLINVLRGEMSVVGPRPALPQEVAAYPERARGRLSVKPGLTGIWQVSGRADIGFEKMIDMDLAYARSGTVLLDVLLLALTFRAVISGRGAY